MLRQRRRAASASEQPKAARQAKADDSERMFPVNHKTVIVVDHSRTFSQSGNELLNLDSVGKHAQSAERIAPFAKTLWTCGVEAVLEYCRVVFDLFPGEEKVFSLVSADAEAKVLTAWFSEDQVYDQLLKVFRDEGPPLDTGISLSSAIAECMTMLMYLTVKQTNLLSRPGVELRNRARVIFLTQFESDEVINDFVLSFAKEIRGHNASQLAKDYTEYPIDFCDFVIANVHPLGREATVTERDGVKFGEFLRLSVHNFSAGEALARSLVNLTARHYGLASTCVQDIPMKEETPAAGQQQSNRNYDVELIHDASAHSDFLAVGAFEPMAGEHLVFDTSVGLKWQTPKNQAVEMLNCSRACRVTAADVIARHSVCLINFLRGPPSRFVMLESCSPAGRRSVTHMLASHGGDICLHVLHAGRQLFDSLPPGCEARGARTADYRVTDFRELLHRSRLFPAREAGDYQTLPYERAMEHLRRSTIYWPLTINDSVLMSVNSSAKSLVNLLSEESLEEEEIRTCENLIKKYLDMEARGEPISVSNRQLRSAKREELYRLLFVELDHLLSSYAPLSAGHNQVLLFLRRFRPPEPPQPTGLAYLDSLRQQQPQELNSADGDTQQQLQQQQQQQPLAKRPRPDAELRKLAQSLQEWHEQRLLAEFRARRPDFEGRQLGEAGEQFQLYQHMLQQQQQQQQQPDTRSKDPRTYQQQQQHA